MTAKSASVKFVHFFYVVLLVFFLTIYVVLLVFFLTIYVFGSCFRMLAVNFVLDFGGLTFAHVMDHLLD